MKILRKYLNRFNKMQWNFSIITDGKQTDRVNSIIDSIEDQGIHRDNYQILVIGGPQFDRKNTTIIAFDERLRENHITRKKNLAAQCSKFQNMIIVHDYVKFLPNWYSGWIKFNDENWDCAMNRVWDINGLRHRDWVTYNNLSIQYVDYNNHDITNIMYQSGTYIVIKKDFLLKHPFDETKVWGESEDVAFSYGVRHHWKYKFNPYSTVQFMKEKHIWPPHTQEYNWKQNGGII